jgi:hypothetical protein
MAAARRARVAHILAPEKSFLFVNDMFDIAFGDDVFKDEITVTMRSEQEAILERHGIDDVRDIDPTWYAPEEWWELNRRCLQRSDNIMCGLLRRLEEHDLAALIESEGGENVSNRLALVEEAMAHA